MSFISKTKSTIKSYFYWFNVLQPNSRSFVVVLFSFLSIFLILGLMTNVVTTISKALFCFFKSDTFSIILTLLTLVGMFWGLYRLRGIFLYWIKRIKYRRISEYTYRHYIKQKVDPVYFKLLSRILAKRYSCELLHFHKENIPSTILWEFSQIDHKLGPNKILGNLEIESDPIPFSKSIHLDKKRYGQARAYIKDVLENDYNNFGKKKKKSKKIQGEAIDYRMLKIDIDGNIPRIDGKFGYFYDNLLTQYALEWELMKATKGAKVKNLESRLEVNLPFRKKIESSVDNPLINGSNRCAVISFSTLIVFKRKREYYTLINKRSPDVAVSPNMYHVVPAGMFEAENTFDNWDLESNIMREILEEVYDDRSHMNPGERIFPEYIGLHHPIPKIREMLSNGSAELCVTGICVDLLNLRPEICTILFADNEDFFKLKEIKFNWEYAKDNQSGKGIVPVRYIDKFVERNINTPGFVVSGASCLTLGLKWLEKFHPEVFRKE